MVKEPQGLRWEHELHFSDPRIFPPSRENTLERVGLQDQALCNTV